MSHSTQNEQKMESKNNVFDLILTNNSRDQGEVMISDNSYNIFSVKDIYKMYRVKLCHDYGLSVEKYNYKDKKERSTRTHINRKSLAARKYLMYLAEVGAPIEKGTMALYKKLIRQRYEQGKIGYSKFRIYTNTGLKQFVDWCMSNRIYHCKKDAPVQKYKIVGEEIILRFSDWAKNYKKVNYETYTSYQHVLRLNKYFTFLRENDIGIGVNMVLINKFLESQQITIATVNNYRSTFRLFAKFLLEVLPSLDKDRVEDVEATKMELSKVAKLRKLNTGGEGKIKIALSREQREHLLNSCKTARHRVMVALAAYSGLRCVSIQRLTWEDVDFYNKTIKIWNKGHSDKKERPMPLIVHNALAELKAEINDVDEGDYVITSRKGGGHKGKSTTGSIISVLVTAGLREVKKFGKTWSISAHNLRHTFATRLLEDTGGDIVTVSHMLCHSDTKITMEYLKCLKQEKADSLFVEQYSNIFAEQYEADKGAR